MFHSPEHALYVAMLVQQWRIEPRNATAAICEQLRRNKLGEAGAAGQLPDMTPHDWHAQAVMTERTARRVLGSSSLEWAAIFASIGPADRTVDITAPGYDERGEFGEVTHHVNEFALRVSMLADHVRPVANMRDDMALDLVVQRQIGRGQHIKQADIAQTFGLSERQYFRVLGRIREPLRDLLSRAYRRLDDEFERTGIVGQLAECQ